MCTDSDPFISWHPEEARKWYAKSWNKKFRQKFKFWIFPKNSNTRHTSWSWLIRCVDLKWNLANILGDTERARFGLQTDGRTDGQTDGRTKWNQYTPLNFVGEGYMLSLKNMERNSRQKLSLSFWRLKIWCQRTKSYNFRRLPYGYSRRRLVEIIQAVWNVYFCMQLSRCDNDIIHPLPRSREIKLNCAVIYIKISRTLKLTRSNAIARRHGLNCSPWWRYPIETFSALLVLCEGNSPITGEFPSQRPVTQSFDVFFDLRLNKRLSKQSRRRWFETPSRSLWRHCNVRPKSRLAVYPSHYRSTWSYKNASF